MRPYTRRVLILPHPPRPGRCAERYDVDCDAVHLPSKLTKPSRPIPFVLTSHDLDDAIPQARAASPLEPVGVDWSSSMDTWPGGLATFARIEGGGTNEAGRLNTAERPPLGSTPGGFNRVLISSIIRVFLSSQRSRGEGMWPAKGSTPTKWSSTLLHIRGCLRNPRYLARRCLLRVKTRAQKASVISIRRWKIVKDSGTINSLI